ncbi:MAG: methyltransferase [Candidatus Saccharibacteria bacterium]|nr:methyltransferase [Candidatus Saccharibacteria bacterium]
MGALRIIAGQYKNRSLASPKTTKTHPMSEQIRGAIFNTLGDIEGLTVLDTFAGSGAIGLEAISRGAEAVVLIDADKSAQKAIADNIQDLAMQPKAKLIKTTISNWLATTIADQRFDIVIADPPYHDVQLPTIARLTERIATDGWLVLSWPGKESLPVFPDCVRVVERSYGDAQLGYYQKVN